MTARTVFSYRTLMVLVFITALAAFSSTLQAQMDMKSDDSLSISGRIADMAFYAGGEIEVSATSDDDIFVAGGKLTFNGTGADHLLIGGGEITARDIAVSDIIIAGGNIDLVSGTVSDDIVAMGGNIMLKEGLTLAGSLVVTGGNIDIDTDIGGELRGSAGNVFLNGSVGGDVFLEAGNISIGPGVVIDGDLSYQADEFTIDPDAAVTGQIVEMEFKDKPEPFSIEAIIAALVAMMLFMAGLGLLVLAIVAIFPGLMNRSSEMIAEKPFVALGIGFVMLILLPLVSILLMVSIVGTSAGLALSGLYMALIPFALAAFAYFAGMKLRTLMGHTDEPFIVARIVWTFVAGLILLVLGIIPFIGMLVWLVALLLGMGAIVLRGGSALADA